MSYKDYAFPGFGNNPGFTKREYLIAKAMESLLQNNVVFRTEKDIDKVVDLSEKVAHKVWEKMGDYSDED